MGTAKQARRLIAATTSAMTALVGVDAQRAPSGRSEVVVCVDSSGRARLGLDFVCVANRGANTARARILFDIIDASGGTVHRIKLQARKDVATVAPARLGGAGGVILRAVHDTVGTRVVDSILATHGAYGLRVTLFPIGDRTGEHGRLVVRLVDSQADPDPRKQVGQRRPFPSRWSSPRAVRLMVRPFSIPRGWIVSGLPSTNAFVLRPQDTVAVSLKITAPEGALEGTGTVVRVVLLDNETGAELQEHEWLRVIDSTPPQIMALRYLVFPDRSIAVRALVGDRYSPDLRVTFRLSSDSGATWESLPGRGTMVDGFRAAFYEAHFASFRATERTFVSVAAADEVGNVSISLPEDADAFMAPLAALHPLGDLSELATSQLAFFEFERLVDVATQLTTLLNEANTSRTGLVASGQTRQFDASLTRVHYLSNLLDLAHLVGLEPLAFTRLSVDPFGPLRLRDRLVISVP